MCQPFPALQVTPNPCHHHGQPRRDVPSQGWDGIWGYFPPQGGCASGATPLGVDPRPGEGAACPPRQPERQLAPRQASSSRPHRPLAREEEYLLHEIMACETQRATLGVRGGDARRGHRREAAGGMRGSPPGHGDMSPPRTRKPCPGAAGAPWDLGGWWRPCVTPRRGGGGGSRTAAGCAVPLKPRKHRKGRAWLAVCSTSPGTQPAPPGAGGCSLCPPASPRDPIPTAGSSPGLPQSGDASLRFAGEGTGMPWDAPITSFLANGDLGGHPTTTVPITMASWQLLYRDCCVPRSGWSCLGVSPACAPHPWGWQLRGALAQVRGWGRPRSLPSSSDGFTPASRL